jgi:hypothetical protein
LKKVYLLRNKKKIKAKMFHAFQWKLPVIESTFCCHLTRPLSALISWGLRRPDRRTGTVKKKGDYSLANHTKGVAVLVQLALS